MLTKRIIPCLDVKNGQVVKGVQFKGHEVVGDILSLAQAYSHAGADEVVLNCMNQDGVRNGYDMKQLNRMRQACQVPLIASGGAGCMQDFVDVFNHSQVDGALAASVFHKQTVDIHALKEFLAKHSIPTRLG